MKHVIYLLLFGLLVACTNPGSEPMEPVSFVKWVENQDNGLKVVKEFDQFKFSLQYRPLEYISVLENRDKQLTEATVTDDVNELHGLQYYVLKIQSKTANEMLETGIDNEEEYFERLYYFTSLAQIDISLVQGTDTLPTVLYHFERNYGLAPYNNMVLAFEENNIPADRQLIFNDQVLGLGPVKLMISQQAINRLPELKTKNL